jgi:hypothetical protein
MSQSARQIAGNQRRTLRKMRQQLLAMADAWEDLDEFIRSRFTELAEQVEQVNADMAATDDFDDGNSAPL